MSNIPGFLISIMLFQWKCAFLFVLGITLLNSICPLDNLISYMCLASWILFSVMISPNMKLISNHHLSEPLATYRGSFSTEWVDGYHLQPTARMIKEAWAHFLVIKSSVTSGFANIMPWRDGTNQCYSWQIGSDQLKQFDSIIMLGRLRLSVTHVY